MQKTKTSIFLACLLIAGAVAATHIAFGRDNDDRHRRVHGASFQRVATLATYRNNSPANLGAATVSEIVAATRNGTMLVYTDSPGKRIGFVDITNPANPQPAGVVALNGAPTELASDLITQVQAQTGADSVTLLIERDGRQERIQAPLMAPEAPDDPPRLGITVQTIGLTADLPFPVEITPKKILGGPSAGLMFTLTLYDLLTPGDLIVANDTRVFPARLVGRRDPSGGAVECLLLERATADTWQALVHPGQKLKPGARMLFDDAARALVKSACKRLGLAERPDGAPRKPKKTLRVGLTFNMRREAGDEEAEFDSPKTIEAIAAAIESYGHTVVHLEADVDLPMSLAASGS